MAKSTRSMSIQGRFKPDRDRGYTFYSPMNNWVRMGDYLPPYGDSRRDLFLSEYWKYEPILAGAINVMIKRMRATGYWIEGGRNNALRWAKTLQAADGGNGWQVFITKWVTDYLTTDTGAIIEVGLSGDGRPAAVFNMDSTKCTLWREHDFPIVYTGPDGKMRKIPRKSIIHASDSTSPREGLYNRGYCAISRVHRAGEVIVGIYDYELQKMGKLPPVAIGTIQGITRDQFLSDWAQYKEQRKQAGLDVYTGIFWIGGDDPSVPVQVSIEDISRLPEQFDRNTMLESWVKTIALNLGVDVGELWLIQHVGATKASQSIQHQKALGKGTGEIHAILEMALNTRVLPADTTFSFDFQDDEQDMMAANIMTAKINNLIAIYTQSSRGLANYGGLSAPFSRSGAGNVTPGEEPTTIGTTDWTPPLINRDQAIELGTKWGIFPPGFFGQEVTTVAGMILKMAGMYLDDELIRVTSDGDVYYVDREKKRREYALPARILVDRLPERKLDELIGARASQMVKNLAESYGPPRSYAVPTPQGEISNEIISGESEVGVSFKVNSGQNQTVFNITLPKQDPTPIEFSPVIQPSALDLNPVFEFKPEFKPEFSPEFKPEFNAEFKPEFRPEFKPEFSPSINVESPTVNVESPSVSIEAPPAQVESKISVVAPKAVRERTVIIKGPDGRAIGTEKEIEYEE